MRYNPATDNAVENERIQAEMQFSFKPQTQPEAPRRIKWAELETLQFQAVKLGLKPSHGMINCASLSHDITVAEAMGNWAESRRLRSQLIAGIW